MQARRASGVKAGARPVDVRRSTGIPVPVSRSCAVPMTRGALSTYMRHRVKTCISVDLPFCRATSRTTVRKRNVPSGSSSSAWINVHFCHGSRLTSRTFSAKSMHSNPAVVAGIPASGSPACRGRSGA